MKPLPEPNHSILTCPDCKKPLVNMGSKVERIHPLCRFMENHDMKIVFAWMTLITIFIMLGSMSGGGSVGLGGSRSIGFGWVALLSVPFTFMYFLKRAFPLYRITDCPYCGYHEEQKLGRSHSG